MYKKLKDIGIKILETVRAKDVLPNKKKFVCTDRPRSLSRLDVSELADYYKSVTECLAIKYG